MKKPRLKKFEYYQLRNGKWWWHVKAGNGKIIDQNQQLKRQQSCRAAYLRMGFTPETCFYTRIRAKDAPKPEHYEGQLRGS